jgi:hypothetical protein
MIVFVTMGHVMAPAASCDAHQHHDLVRELQRAPVGLGQRYAEPLLRKLTDNKYSA